LSERLDPSKKYTQALILAPTRELGKQIAEQLILFSKNLPKINMLAVYGGTSISGQMKDLKRKPQHVIIATPGRLIDLIKRKAIKLDKVRAVILDEADEMLNMGFKDDLDLILDYTPDDKMTWLFSATMPKAIKKIVKTYMEDPNEVRIDPKNEVNKKIKHQYVAVRPSDKTEALTRFIDVLPGLRGVVFCRTKRDTQNLAELLQGKSYQVDALHGDLSQQMRDRVMKRFKNHDLQILIATDVAARGIDVKDLTHIFHYSLPDDNAYYTHRSGRTARAGKEGISMSFVSRKDGGKIRRLERDLGISFEQIQIPKSEDIVNIRIANWGQKILDQKAKGELDKELADKVHEMFSSLTKEALIAKLIVQELKKLKLDSSKDLNDKSESGGRGSRESRGSRGSRSRSDSDRRSRGAKKKYGRSRDSRSKSDDRNKSRSKSKSKSGESRGESRSSSSESGGGKRTSKIRSYMKRSKSGGSSSSGRKSGGKSKKRKY